LSRPLARERPDAIGLPTTRSQRATAAGRVALKYIYYLKEILGDDLEKEFEVNITGVIIL
jgi:hypothetical protein